MFHATVDWSEYRVGKREMMAELRELRFRAVNEASRVGANSAKRRGRYQNQTGELRGSIKPVRARATSTGVLGGYQATAKHASYVEYGTRPHEILPLNYDVRSGRPVSRISGKRVTVQAGAGRGKFLRFYIGGRVVFAKRVMHPGTAPDPFMDPSAVDATVALTEHLERGITKMANRIWSRG